MVTKQIIKMAKTSAERQEKFRKSKKYTFERLDVRLSITAIDIIKDKAKEHGVTKVKYLTRLILDDDKEPLMPKEEYFLFDRNIELITISIKNEKVISELKDKIKNQDFILNKHKNTIKELKKEAKILNTGLKVKLQLKNNSINVESIKLLDRIKNFANDNLKLGNINNRSALLVAAKIELGFPIKGKPNKANDQIIYDWIKALTEQQRINIVRNSKKDKNVI
jgi:predicted DNA binding CopG/RHH family protein